MTGAGRGGSAQLTFSEVNGNFRAYRVGEHQHVPEMEEVLTGLLGNKTQVIFTPHLLPVNRGILATLYFRPVEPCTTGELIALYENFYRETPFVRILPEGVYPAIKDVLYTNFCDIGIKVDQERQVVIVIAVIDNLVKGAAGQAIQNMNLVLGLGETRGLL
ncbi:MAG: Asd/ArgC dimerization domain-containing protein [Candidatus Omnitrophota bacterium]